MRYIWEFFLLYALYVLRDALVEELSTYGILSSSDM